MPLISALLYSVFSWNGLARGELRRPRKLPPRPAPAAFQLLDLQRVLQQRHRFRRADARAERACVLHRLPAPEGSPGPPVPPGRDLRARRPLRRDHRRDVETLSQSAFRSREPGSHGVGLASWAQPWLGQSSTALGSLILVNTWHWLGFPALVYLAGMQRISAETIEAARLDGASDWQVLTKIIWPLVAPATTVIVILTFIGSFNWFELPYVMGGDRRLAGRRDRRARALFLPDGLRRSDLGPAGFRPRERARGLDVHRHRRRLDAVDTRLAPARDPGIGRAMVQRAQRDSPKRDDARDPVVHDARDALSDPRRDPFGVQVDGGDLLVAFLPAGHLQPHQRRDDLARDDLSALSGKLDLRDRRVDPVHRRRRDDGGLRAWRDTPSAGTSSSICSSCRA